MKPGQRVRVRQPHMKGQEYGVLVHKADSPAWSVRFPGSNDPHRWYTESELEPVETTDSIVDDILRKEQ